MMLAGAGAARATGSSTTDRKICSTDRGGRSELIILVGLTRAREATRHRRWLRQAADRLEPALRLLATSPFRFSRIVVRRFWFGGDDGARAIGVTADAAVAGAEISYRVIDK
jgi:hypothetical protein